MKYLLVFLLSFLSSCGPASSLFTIKQIQDLKKENKELKQELKNSQSCDSDYKSLEFKMRNIKFDLDHCLEKYKRQDIKLVQCLKLKEN
jgi:hypothetical protein